jgi:chromosome segregation ATPase
VDLTNATLPELKARKKEVEELLASGTVTVELTDERNLLMNKISEMGGNEEESVEDETDQVVVRALEEIDLFGVPLGMYFADVTDHIAVRTVVLAKVRQIQNDLEESQFANYSQTEEYENKISELQRQIEERDTQITELKAEKYEVSLLAEDRMTRINNAYNEILEAKQTIDELNDKLAAATAPKAPTLTNLDGAAGYVKKEKRVIYDVQEKGKNKFTAKYADTDEEFEDYTIYMDGKYRVVEKADADTFRQLYLDQHPTPMVETAPEVEPTAPPIREEDAAELGLDQENTGVEVAGQAVTRAEFTALEAEVFAIKARLNL